MAILTFNPASLTVVVAGHIVTGYDDGTFVAIERAQEMWTLKMGADGIGTRTKTNDKSGHVTVTLLQSSPSNDVLSALAIADEQSGTGAVPLLVRDGSGRTVASAATAWIAKLPNVEFSKDVTNRAWQFHSDALALFIGGSGTNG